MEFNLGGFYTTFTQKVNFTNGTKIEIYEISYVVDDVNLVLFSRFHVKPQMHPGLFCVFFRSRGPKVQNKKYLPGPRNKESLFCEFLPCPFIFGSPGEVETIVVYPICDQLDCILYEL